MTGEAIALVHAAAMCRDGGLENIILEGDAKQVVDELNSNGSRWCRFGQLIDDIQHILQKITRWRCVFIKREANEAAHRLAKRATTNIKNRIWRNQIPDYINDVVLMEQLALSL